MKKLLKVAKMGNLLIIDGEYYEPIYAKDRAKDELLHFRHVDKKKFEALKEEIAEKLKHKITTKDVIENALADMGLRSLERITAELKKSKPRVKKQYGCFDIVVGEGRHKSYIPIR